MFTVQINNRLKDIKGSKDDFGGVSIIAIGDLFQLQPYLMDMFLMIFRIPSTAYCRPIYGKNTLQCTNLKKY